MAKRLIHTATHTTGAGTIHTAKVYRDSDWNEWFVVFACAGVKLEKSTYHTGDKADAIDTANYHIKRVSAQFA